MKPLNRSLTTTIFTCLFLSGISFANDTDWNPGAIGDWSDPANWSNGVPTKNSITSVRGGGTVRINQTGLFGGLLILSYETTIEMTSGSLTTSTEDFDNSGSFNQAGGLHTTGFMSIYGGNYNLSGTGSLITESFYMHSGIFNQTAGVNQALGSFNIEKGTYNLGGTGQLTTSFLNMHSGNFNQTGGNNHGWDLSLSMFGSGESTYTLSGGQIKTACQSIGKGGSFIQTGGINQAGNLFVADSWTFTNSTLSAGYTLTGGELQAQNEQVTGNDPTFFHQTGGLNTAEYLSIGNQSRYDFTGGSLHVHNGLDLQGILNLGDSNAQIIADGGIINLAGGTLLNTRNASFSAGADAFVILPSDFDPNSTFKNYQNDGRTHTSGTPLVIAAGETITVTRGTINDLVECQGTIAISHPDDGNNFINLNSGIKLSAGGQANLGMGQGTVVADNALSLVSGGDLACNALFVGREKSGQFTQTGGTITLTDVEIGNKSTGQGIYYQTGGTLQTEVLRAGGEGEGTFEQSGGTTSISSELVLGYNPGSSGTYRLKNTGHLSADSETIGDEGTGQFEQTGGINLIGQTLCLGNSVGSEGTYRLSGTGILLAGQEIIGKDGTGTFIQSGGENRTDLLVVGPAGRYELSAGTLQINQGINVKGTFDLTGSNTSLVFQGAIVNFTGGTIANASNASLILDQNSLLILPEGVDPQILFANYVNLGLTHTAGTPLAIGNNRNISGAGDINDHVTCTGGTLTAGKNMAINLNGGLTLENGKIDLGKGILTVDDETSGIIEGQLLSYGGKMCVGNNGTGSFTQTHWGSVNLIPDFYSNGTLVLGNNYGSHGTYNLGGSGELSTGEEVIGYEGTGNFNQTGGTNRTRQLTMGSKGNIYSLSGGDLIADTEYIFYGSNLFCHSGGTNATKYLSVDSRYQLSGTGVLTAESEYIGGQFVQTGGANTVGDISIRGTYEFSGGSLRIRNGLKLSGVLDGQGMGNTIIADDAILNLTGGTLANVGQTTMIAGRDSLTIYSPGHSPENYFKTFQTEGLLHEAGTTLTIPAGRTVRGSGTLDDHVVCSGTITASPSINMTNGLTLTQGADVDLGNGVLEVNDLENNMTGGKLRTYYETIGDTQPGTFRQTGGVNTTQELYIGGNCSGTYTLAGGTLDAHSVCVGPYMTSTDGRLEITDSKARINISDILYFGPNSSLAAAPGATIHFFNNTVTGPGTGVINNSTNAAALDALKHMIFIFEGGNNGTNQYEIAGKDMGGTLAGFENNFALGTLTLGGIDTSNLQLIDLYENQPDWNGREALYVYHLNLGAGSVLDLNGFNLYYLDGVIDFAHCTILNGSITQVPEPAALIIWLSAIPAGLAFYRGRGDGRPRRPWGSRPSGL
jgi:hypothetical protein